MNTKETRALNKRMKFLRELLLEFGLRLHGYDPGVKALIIEEPITLGDFKIPRRQRFVDFDRQEWDFLEPLLIELRDQRKLY